MKAIIFDFDVVLADTADFNKNLTKEVGHDVSEEEFKAHHDGNVMEQPRIPFTKESADNFFAKYLERITQVKPFFSQENIHLLKSLCPLYIISSSPKSAINKFLKCNNLEYFDEVLGVDFHKSKVEKFKYLFKKYSLNPNDVIFVSDTLGDILEAKNVDVKTIAVDFGFHDRIRIKKGNPFKIVSNFDELLETIKDFRKP